MKLLVIDDHPVLREGLAALLLLYGPDTEVLQARNTDEGLALLDANADLDVIVLDLFMPGTDGFAALSLFRHRRPELPIIVLSSSEDPKHVRAALASGAMGYVPKSANHQVLLSAVRLAMNGELYVPPLILEAAPALPVGDGEAAISPPALLTERQTEILTLLSDGKPNKTIASSLGLSEKTVKTHLTAIFKALKVQNRTQAAAAGRQTGLIS